MLTTLYVEFWNIKRGRYVRKKAKTKKRAKQPLWVLGRPYRYFEMHFFKLKNQTERHLKHVTSYQLPKAVTSWLFAILLISLFPIPQNFFISYSPKLLKPLTLAKEMSFTGLAPAGAVVRSADSQSARLHQLHSVRHPSSRFLPCC